MGNEALTPAQTLTTAEQTAATATAQTVSEPTAHHLTPDQHTVTVVRVDRPYRPLALEAIVKY